MNMEDYIDTLKGQIRDKNAKSFVANEIRSHIEEQADVYENGGLSRDDALEKAVKDMGDPVSVGINLDKIHRPHMEWRFLGYILFISVLSIVIHYLINRGMNPGQIGFSDFPRSTSRAHIMGILVSVILMLVVYRLDYTVLLGKSRIIGGIFLTVITLLSIPFGYYVNGVNGWIGIGSVSVSVHAIFLLYLPIFAGILYEYRGKGKIAILWIFLWGIAPIVSRLINGDWSVPFMLFMLIAELILIFLAIRKDWYLFSKKAVLIGFICVVIVMAAMCFNKVMHFNDYQRLRLENWMARYNIGNYVSDDNGMNYINTMLKDVFANSNLIGRSDEAVQIMTELPGYRDDLIVGSIAAYCGMLAVVGIIICLLVLSMYVFRISLKQKNNLGYIIGCACGITIAFQCVSNLMIVFGLLPMTGSFLPMISHGTSRNIVNYMLFGLILSIYRYKDIRKEDMMKSVLAKGKVAI